MFGKAERSGCRTEWGFPPTVNSSLSQFEKIATRFPGPDGVFEPKSQ